MAAPTVVSINIAPGRRLPTRSVEEVLAEAGKGLVGDRYHGAKHRHVTVQSRAQLDRAEAAHTGPIPDAGTRRNITVSHGDVPTTPGTRVRLGGALLEVVRVAAPCRLLDDDLGPGAQKALRHLAGTCFRVLETGAIRLGDSFEIVPADSGD